MANDWTQIGNYSVKYTGTMVINSIYSLTTNFIVTIEPN